MTSKRQKNAGYRLPDPIDGYPLIDLCMQIPDNELYKAAVLGAIKKLGEWFNWEKAYTPGDTRAVQASALFFGLINDTLKFGDCATMGVTDVRIVDCEVQVQYTGSTDWIVVGTLADCADTRAQQLIDSLLADGTLIGVSGIQDLIQDGALSGGQQPPPTPRPGIVTCRVYYVTLTGNGKWLCPIPLYAGDSIEVKDASGGWWDGGEVNWRCPDGKKYVLGECNGSPEPFGGDPATGIGHMRIIGFDGLTYRDMYHIKYTPTNTISQFVLQANDSNIDNNKGSVNLTIEVCTNEYVGDCYSAASMLSLMQSDQCVTGSSMPWHAAGNSVQFNGGGFPISLLIDLSSLSGGWPNKSGPWKVKAACEGIVSMGCQTSRLYPPCQPGLEYIAGPYFNGQPINPDIWYDIPATKNWLGFFSNATGNGQINSICVQ